jgi:hypothetical protein
MRAINFTYLITFDFVCPANKHCPCVRCACAANAVCKYVYIFAVRVVSLEHIYTHQPKTVTNICSYSYCSVVCSS